MNKLTCVSCPIGCELNVDVKDGKVLSVTGNSCKRGIDYAKNEVQNPKRMLTTTVKLLDGILPLVPVRTKTPIPKTLLKACMDSINGVDIKAPVISGQTIIPNILNTGIDVIATRSVAHV